MSKKTYEDFFEKPYNLPCFNKDLYEKTITHNEINENYSGQLKNLFKVCFSHHVEPEVYLNKNQVKKLTFRMQDEDDIFFEEDNISAYFLSEKYDAPALYHGYIDRIDKKKLTFDNYRDILDENTIVDFETFKMSVTKTAVDDPDNAGLGGLGSNLVRFVVGEIGEGKSILLTALYRDILLNPEKYDRKKNEAVSIRLIPIYYEISFEKNEYPEPLENYFFYELYRKSYDTVENLLKKNFVNLTDELDFKKFNLNKDIGLDEHTVIKSFIKFIEYLADNNIRLLIIIDNLDMFHYFFARYAFFDEGLNELNRSIHSLESMMKKFMPSSKDSSSLRNAGLSVIFAMRGYVYDYLKTRNALFHTKENESKSLYTLLPIDNTQVLLPRVSLFKDALKIVADKIELADWHQKLYFDQIDQVVSQSKSNYYKKIIELSHHGNRSLVEFITTLSIDIRDEVLSERMLLDPKSIVLDLYILNNKKKYSQQEDFFPNLFLNDCLVYKPEKYIDEAHQSHKHTYFLKYFILKYIVKQGGATYKKVYKIFKKYYDEHLVKHVIGSLCTANEFQCAEIPLAKTMSEIMKDRIEPTRRGLALMSTGDNPLYPNLEFCMSFQYLSHVVDDRWLSFPEEYIEDIYNCTVNFDLAYNVRQNGREYSEESILLVRNKNKNVLNFILLLKSSLKCEIECNNDFKSFLEEEDLLPDFDNIIMANIDSVGHILQRLHYKGNYTPKNVYKKIDKEKFNNFFKDYKNQGCPNVDEI